MKDLKNTDTAIENYKLLSNVILDVLKSWENPIHCQFDAMWYGYESLLDEVKQKGVETSLKDLKTAMKKLRKQGVVKLKPTYESDWTMCGSGYFIEPTYNAI